MGDSIRADVTGLSVLAACCENQAAAVRDSSGATALAGDGFPATTAAVGAAFEIVTAADHRISDRLDSTATASTGAAAGYRSTELQSAVRIAAVAPSSSATIEV